MEAIHPHFAWLWILVVLPILLYLIRRRVAAVEVSTLVFFKNLAKEHRESSWLRRMKKWLSLLLTLLMISGGILALMRVSFRKPDSQLRNIVILLDRSASMGARTSEARTRLERSVAAIGERLKRLPSRTEVSLVAFDRSPEVVQPFTRDRSQIIRALQELEVRSVEGQTEKALELAKALAEKQTPSQIWFVSDRPPLNEGSEVVEGVQLEGMPLLDQPRLNVGITAFRLRPVPLQRSQQSCFVELTRNEVGGEPVEARLVTAVGGVQYPPRSVVLQPGESKVLEFPVEGLSGQELRLQLEVEEDCFSEDDAILVKLSSVQPIVAVRVGPRETIDPFLHVALQSLVEEGELQIWSAAPEQWPIRDVDVVIFDNWLPSEWPEDLPAIVVSPPGELDPVWAEPLRQGGIPQPDLRVVEDEHPILYRVSSGDLSVLQTAVLEPSPGLSALWTADGEPLLLAGEENGQRLVIMGFSPRRSSQLPLTSSFPLLVGNAIYWCAESKEDSDSQAQYHRRTGEVVPVSGKEVRWRSAGEGRSSGGATSIRRGLLEMDRTGLWETDAGESGAAHLLSLQETQEAGGALLGEESGLRGESFQAKAGRGLTGELTRFLIASILVLLVVESILLHRFAVY